MTEMSGPDLAPRAGEIDDILARGRRRRAMRSGLPAVAAVGVLATVVALTGGAGERSAQQIDITDDPQTPVTEGPRLLTSPTSPTDVMPSGSGQPVPSVTGPPESGVRPSAQPTRSPQPQPTASGDDRPFYDGEIGPRVVRAGAADCQNRIVDPANPVRVVVRNGYCISYGSGSTSTGEAAPDFMPVQLEICRVLDSTEEGRLDYTRGEETDFALYRAHQDLDGRAVLDSQLYRFSDGYRYTATSHSLPVPRGDCYVWEDEVPFDADSYRPREGFVLRTETRTTTLPADFRTFDLYFEARDVQR